MATVDDINQIPLSGDKFVDALIDKGPTWNYLLPNNGNVLYYTFTDDGTHTSGISSVTTFNSDQKTAAQDALTYVSSVIGIDFVETSSAAQAQLAFFSANLSDANTAGLTSSESSYSYTSNEVISTYDVDADIFLDVFEFKDNLNPKIGTEGYQVLLHELGHALGLKHPFEGTNQLPEDIDNTNHTLMSYTWTGAPKAEYQEYDLAALWWIYGGDGLGGEYGVNSVYGSTLMQTIVPTANTTGILTLINTTNGRNLTNAQQGDILSASVTDSDGMDNAFFQWLANGIAITGAKNSSYTLTATDVGKTITVAASYTDKLGTAENVVSTATSAVASLGNHLPTGAITISGTATQGQTLAVTNTLADADGLGGMTYVWITNGVATVTANTYTLTQEDVGKTITVAANYIDSMGNSERVFSAATAAVANVNDLPTGAVTISGTATKVKP
ncbi:matrixin family metalloprotease [Chromatium okenii]|uniref:Peptidase metallopeptidase domain-containing protein n=1 Tax=Chromatium okenii TaxID=61644 RepID=A0A2S7XMC2_9GAMM|nr:matrixin family metalloprotease [Chromatium okenii]PQJ94885.1 hypothetical protein CXB77_17245 [Chromatium okenii]